MSTQDTIQNTNSQNQNRMKWWHCVIIYIVANVIALLPAGFNGNEAFYNSFLQPSIAPPDWLFAPMWFFLNITSLIGLYKIVNLPLDTKYRKEIIRLEIVSWIVYCTFTFLYFYLKSPILGAIDTFLGLVVTIPVVKMSYDISKVAFWNFLPRLLWLILASYVSIWIALHNKDIFLNVGPFIK
jgi:translocator protein